jgi:hypothetical protein
MKSVLLATAILLGTSAGAAFAAPLNSLEVGNPFPINAPSTSVVAASDVGSQVAAGPATQSSRNSSGARTYAEMSVQRGTASTLGAPARPEQMAPWNHVVISHKIGDCGLLCRSGIAE